MIHITRLFRRKLDLLRPKSWELQHGRGELLLLGLCAQQCGQQRDSQRSPSGCRSAIVCLDSKRVLPIVATSMILNSFSLNFSLQEHFQNITMQVPTCLLSPRQSIWLASAKKKKKLAKSSLAAIIQGGDPKWAREGPEGGRVCTPLALDAFLVFSFTEHGGKGKGRSAIPPARSSFSTCNQPKCVLNLEIH